MTKLFTLLCIAVISIGAFGLTYSSAHATQVDTCNSFLDPTGAPRIACDKDHAGDKEECVRKNSSEVPPVTEICNVICTKIKLRKDDIGYLWEGPYDCTELGSLLD
jgi:hypothetical protein